MVQQDHIKKPQLIGDAVRVVHIFPPCLRSRFVGTVFTWRFNFSQWSSDEVQHLVLDHEKHVLVDAEEALDFDLSDVQQGSSRWERCVWVFSLIHDLIRLRRSYDVIHFHVLWWAGLLTAVWAKRRKVPAIFESVLLDFDTPGAIRNEKLGWLKIRYLKKFRSILAISDALGDDYRRNGFPESQVFPLINSVDTNLFRPIRRLEEKIRLREDLHLPPGAKIAIFVGSVVKRKGVDVLAEAFVDAGKQIPDLFLVVVGPVNRKENPSVDEEFIQSLQQQIDANDMSDRVIFHGLVQDRVKLADLYRAADMFIFPSRKEGLGNVVLEAMSSGLPVIVTNLPVLEKVIQHERTGFFVPVDDAPAVSVLIQRLSADRKLASQVGAAARAHIDREHSFAVWEASMVQFYRGLVKG